MEVTYKIDAAHDDLISDVAYNYYGNRIATCGSDHTVKIFDVDSTGVQNKSGEFKVHLGPVCKVAWAHPEFGQVLATCSFDRTAKIWEEQGGSLSGAKGKTSKWAERATLTDSRSAISGIAFAPRHLGLKLAACGEDGKVRIYEACDVMNLSSWSQTEDFTARGKGRCLCLSWNPSRACTMLALGRNAEAESSTVQVWELGAAKRWAAVLDDIGPPNTAINDVAFAPNMGRSYYLLAAACDDKSVRIWRIRTTDKDTSGTAARSKYEAEEVFCSKGEPSSVWRVSWNVTGTVLASSGDDGSVKLWACTPMGEWRNVQVVSGGD
eukprot:m.139340 g.139340  ORF g.139340 m.139340 type:complete len:323 (+) comp17620_c0_seq3:92-1060(+)